jgi:hypothetical protein
MRRSFYAVSSAGTYSTLRKTVCQSLDIGTFPLADFQSGNACDALSFGVRFWADPEAVGDHAVTFPEVGCDGAWRDQSP